MELPQIGQRDGRTEPMMKFTMTCVTTHVSFPSALDVRSPMADYMAAGAGCRGGADAAARPAIGKTNTLESIYHTGRKVSL